MHRTDTELRTLLEDFRTRLKGPLKVSRLLGAIGWPPTVEEEFFRRGAQVLPEVTYSIDQAAVAERITALQRVEADLPDDGTVATWLRSLLRSYIDGNRLILAAGTPAFYALSCEVYGTARTRFFGSEVRNLDLADHLLERLQQHASDELDPENQKELTDEQFAEALRERLRTREPDLKLDIVIDSQCIAKTLAGMSRVRIRRGATFKQWEVDQLWNHEVETHALTAQNGSLQPHVPFLSTGGPRSTRTQEGLAIFTELYHRGLSIERMRRLARRVKLVQMTEDGANFIEVYRYLLGHGVSERDAFLDAQRVFRGGRVEGGGPFTKDACYLAGLLEVYAFMSVAVRSGMREEANLLVAGRISLEDVPVLIDLRRRGLLERPKYIPTWLASWRELLPYFAFTSFVMSEVSVAGVEKVYREVLERATRSAALTRSSAP